MQEQGVGNVHRKLTCLLVLLILLAAASASANPQVAAVSTYSSATWLPADINQKAGRIVDEYLADRHYAAIFDGSKTDDRKELIKRIGKTDIKYTVSIELIGFYEPPYTSTHFSDTIKPSDTVATVMLNYSIYVSATDRFITGRIDNRKIYPDNKVALEPAYLETVRQALPKLSEQLDAILIQYNN